MTRWKNKTNIYILWHCETFLYFFHSVSLFIIMERTVRKLESFILCCSHRWHKVPDILTAKLFFVHRLGVKGNLKYMTSGILLENIIWICKCELHAFLSKKKTQIKTKMTAAWKQQLRKHLTQKCFHMLYNSALQSSKATSRLFL